MARPLDWVSVKGKSAGVLVYELLGLKGEADADTEARAARFAEALMTYRRQAWDEAIRLFEAFLARWAGDSPARWINAAWALAAAFTV